MRYTVVIPVLNQLHYTQQCVASLLGHGVGKLVPGPLELDLPADPERLRTLRRAVHAWGRDTALRSEVVEDLLLAVGEAVANAVEHAYPPGTAGRVGVRLAAGPLFGTGHVLEDRIRLPYSQPPDVLRRAVELLAVADARAAGHAGPALPTAPELVV